MAMGVGIAATTIVANVHEAARQQLADRLQRRDEDAEQAGDDEVADARANVEPAAGVAHAEEEGQRQPVAQRRHEHEERARRDAEAPVEHAEVGADERKGRQDLGDEQRALRKRVEDGHEPVHAVEREGRHARHVARAEEGRLHEEEEEERRTRVGERERAVRRGRRGGVGGGGRGGSRR